ncbi:MAG: translesion DNA synthesis-associated protein ImuA [Pseudomonadales bacterium]|nr:translesion DNA synthesis-associated protein ImuA [Pseudomonadales bacterium]
MNPKTTANKGLGNLLENPQIWRASDTLQTQQCAQQTASTIASGFELLDRELPSGGWPVQGLMELLCPRWGVGEIPLLSPAMAQLSQQGRWLAWVSPPWLPYAPGLINAGVNIEQVLIIKPQSEKQALWAMEECLQSGSCSAVLGWPKNPLPQQLKRLHIAAQKGDSLCVLMRHEQCAQQPSPAPLRIELGSPLSMQQQLSLRILKRRGSWTSDWLKLPLPDCMASLTHECATALTTSADAIKQTVTQLKTNTAETRQAASNIDTDVASSRATAKADDTLVHPAFQSPTSSNQRLPH